MKVSELLNLILYYSKIENRTEEQELEYNYLDKTYQYYELLRMAKEMGNKDAKNNCLVKKAYERMIKAHDELARFKGLA